jgi:hypothetical protein
MAFESFSTRVMNAPRAAVGAAALVAAFAACAPATSTSTAPTPRMSSGAPSPDPRVGLKAGLFDAGEAMWNMKRVSFTQPPQAFLGKWNSDLAFRGNYVFQGNFAGFQVWDISTPSRPTIVKEFVCPASQSDVSVYKNLLFVSGEGLEGRLDCGAQGVTAASSKDRLRGIRIFDISDVRNPKYITNVQTCRGSHTHSVLVDPKDAQNVYVYVSGSAPVRPATELDGCSAAPPSADPKSALFRIEVIKVPLANPLQAAIVNSPRIFEGLTAPKSHGLAPDDKAEIDRARARGAFVVEVQGETMVLPDAFANAQLANVVRSRGGTGAPTAADSAKFREALPAMIAQMVGPAASGDGPAPGPNQCHDITLYPEQGIAGGACEGYGLLLDIKDPANPKRIAAVSDSNFAYWHSATFNNDASKVLFTDEWGGGTAPKCRESDPKSWGANALFTIENGALAFQSYFKLPAAQTATENCVAHNGSMIPVPGRDIMVQSWYQGGISVFDFTDIKNPVEIAYQDRGPIDAAKMETGGTWSVYWYNGLLVSSEIARGLDIFELAPSAHLTQNEIDASKTVRLEYLNPQGQPKYVWPPSFPLALAYLDQLQRSNGLDASRINAVRTSLGAAERAMGGARRDALTQLASQLDGDAGRARDAAKVRLLATAVRDLAAATR